MSGNFTEAGLQEILRRHPHVKYIKVFVETGTFKGETAAMAVVYFPTVHTIELSPELHAAARARYVGSRIAFHSGDTRVVLPRLAETITEPAVFYLDAHWWHAKDVAGGEAPFPLWDELEILAKRHYQDVIVVDDVRTFGKTEPVEDWKDVTLERIADFFPGCIEAVILGDQAVIYRAPHAH